MGLTISAAVLACLGLATVFGTFAFAARHHNAAAPLYSMIIMAGVVICFIALVLTILNGALVVAA